MAATITPSPANAVWGTQIRAGTSRSCQIQRGGATPSSQITWTKTEGRGSLKSLERGLKNLGEERNSPEK